jgi:cardiolipin synthase
VILRKRDSRAAVSWVGLIWLVPGLGALIYAALGVNRIRRRAVRLRRAPLGATSTSTLRAQPPPADIATAHHPGLLTLARLGERVGRRRLVAGNRVTPLCNGEQAYPAMLAAIEAATESVCLTASSSPPIPSAGAS